jgi:hypothetical protein
MSAGATGFTELRVHGVSGTPPKSMLEHPHPERVAGDGEAGFYHRRYPDGSGPPGSDQLEAYSWGGLTSGSPLRALWLLLLPFTLVNVAHWMQPTDLPAQDQRRRILEQALRLLALTLTATLLLSVVGVAMDLAAWQCPADPQACSDWQVLLRFLGTGFWHQPGRRVAVGALLPLAAILLLWRLGTRTWQSNEQERMPAADVLAEPLPLQRRELWNGGEPVRRLRSVHVSAALAVLVGLVCAPTLQHLQAERGPGSPGTIVGWALVAAAALVSALAVIAVLHHQVAERRLPSHEREAVAPAALPPALRLLRANQLLAVVLVALSLVYAALPWDEDWEAAEGSLPGFGLTLKSLFVLQVLCVLLLFATTRLLPRGGLAGQWIHRPLFFGGYGLPILASGGWLLAGGFAAGVSLRVADFLGTPVPGASEQVALVEMVARPEEPAGLIVPLPYFWVALGSSLLFFVIGVVAVRGWSAARGLAAEERAALSEQYHVEPVARGRPPTEDQRRVAAIARTRGWARMSDQAERVATRVSLLVILLVLLGWPLYWRFGRAPVCRWDRPLASSPNWACDTVGPLVNFGTLVVGAFALALVLLGRSAYRNPNLRRTVGIVWDLGTSWPRASHLLAPPCYAERALPDLACRISHLIGDGRPVVLSAHSQGSVIAAALLLQLDDEQREHVQLVTYGCPLQRLYAGAFPAYFGPPMLETLGRLLVRDAKIADPPEVHPDDWRWRNLYRRTDPIGGWVVQAQPIGDRAHADWQLEDPGFRRLPGDTQYPPTRGHSDYPKDEAYRLAVEWVLAR